MLHWHCLSKLLNKILILSSKTTTTTQKDIPLRKARQQIKIHKWFLHEWVCVSCSSSVRTYEIFTVKPKDYFVFCVSLANKLLGGFHWNVNIKVTYEDKKKKFNHDEEGKEKRDFETETRRWVENKHAHRYFFLLTLFFKSKKGWWI